MLRYDSIGDSLKMKLLSYRPAVKDPTDNLLTVLVINKRAGREEKYQQANYYNLKSVFSLKVLVISFVAYFRSQSRLNNQYQRMERNITIKYYSLELLRSMKSFNSCSHHF